MAAPQLTRTHRILIGVVVAGAVVIAGIGFAGSYAAVRSLALQKGFGNFSYVFPIGIDAGICVLLALDLLLTWIRIPFPLLRQTAWLLTAATIAFNGAAAWPDPLGVGMHAVIPILFVVSVEAARHAVGRIADITADKHMEGVRLTRWLLSPLPTFLLWRRMKLWELRSYEQVIKLEQDRLVYQARLHSRFGRAWRRKAPVESLMPLRLARYGVPLAQTAPSGLAAAGIEPALLPPAPAPAAPVPVPELERPAAAATGPQPVPAEPGTPAEAAAAAGEESSPWFATPPQAMSYDGGYDPSYVPEQEYEPWYQEQQEDQVPGQVQEQLPTEAFIPAQMQAQMQAQAQMQEPEFPVPSGPNRTRQLGEGIENGEEPPTEEDLYQVFRKSIDGEGGPTPGTFHANVEATFGTSLEPRELQRYMELFMQRLNSEFIEDHIA
ncbi:DUF2637 domain-containing protein [Streptomyces sp. NBC_01474]|uniref:DUF2637 domain-containing protein n=1 Tax=unclassified Streptomyces TaxID=2593676 RepID=UPI002DD7E9D4|nr:MULTISPECIES: DUF2637 domain-containing protein [unclassified Streptomyces]WSD96845.1 DUF2637 domain-containing protein [Streptomyces sp. NBC_01474]